MPEDFGGGVNIQVPDVAGQIKGQLSLVDLANRIKIAPAELAVKQAEAVIKGNEANPTNLAIQNATNTSAAGSQWVMVVKVDDQGRPLKVMVDPTRTYQGGPAQVEYLGKGLALDLQKLDFFTTHRTENFATMLQEAAKEGFLTSYDYKNIYGTQKRVEMIVLSDHPLFRVVKDKITMFDASKPYEYPLVTYDVATGKSLLNYDISFADDNVLGGAPMELRKSLAQGVGGGVGIEPQPAIHGGANGPKHAWRWRVGVFIRVELDQPLDFRLLAGAPDDLSSN